MSNFTLSKGDIKMSIDAAGNISIDGSAGIERFRQFANSQAKRLALKAREEICKEYMITVGDFYAEFSPRVWKRQFGYFSTFTPFYQNSHGTIYYGGIHMHPGDGDGRYQEGAGAAFGTLMIGKHGPVDGYGPTGLPVQAHMEQFVQYLASYISL